MNVYKFIFWAFGMSFLLTGCDSQQAIVIPDPPTPSFTVTAKSGAVNTYTLKSTTPEAFIFQWDLGGGTTEDGHVSANSAETTVYFPNKGSYNIKLSAWGKGGSASVTQVVTVAQDDPNACRGNMALLTNCAEKTWKLANEPGAMLVGPDLNTVWWGNNQADLTTRACHFNDTYTFTKDGVFRYDNKGDFWADTDGNGAVIPSDLGVGAGCQPASAWPAKYQVWNTATHNFSISDASFQVKGLGAWVGLYKVGEDGEVTAPSSTVTFKIQSITATRMVIYKQYSWGLWKFVLTAQ